MFTKIKIMLISASLIMSSGVTLAQNHSKVGLNREDSLKFYAGPTLGMGMLNTKYKAVNSRVNDLHSSRVSGNSPLIGGVVGIQKIFPSCLFLAGQVNALYNGLNQNVRISSNAAGVRNHIVGIKNEFEYGIDGRIGSSFNGTVPYVLAGVQAGRWAMKLQNNSAINNRGIPANSSADTSKTLYAPKVGMGITFPILQDMNLNLEYNYAWFGKLGSTLTDSLGAEWNHEDIVEQNAVMLGVNWLF